MENWLVVEPTPLKNISQIGNLPQIGKIKNIWNHHLENIGRKPTKKPEHPMAIIQDAYDVTNLSWLQQQRKKTKVTHMPKDMCLPSKKRTWHQQNNNDKHDWQRGKPNKRPSSWWQQCAKAFAHDVPSPHRREPSLEVTVKAFLKFVWRAFQVHVIMWSLYAVNTYIYINKIYIYIYTQTAASSMWYKFHWYSWWDHVLHY